MFAAVHHFLGGERPNFSGQFLGRALAIGTHALDEKRLALGEGRGERIVESRGDRIAGHPPAIGGQPAAEPTVAWGNRQVGGCHVARHRSISCR